MGISGTLSNALSGLTAASRAAEIVSSNVSNALTEGYGRRELEVTSMSLGGNGGGVLVKGVVRAVDHHTIGQRRLAEATLSENAVQTDFLGELRQSIGLPDDPMSLSGRTATLEAALIEATSRPDSDTRLAGVLAAASSLASHLNTISDDIQSQRMHADNTIDQQVQQLNTALVRVADLNHEIRLQQGVGNDATALMDQRQQTIDSISAIVPIREVPRDNGQIALFTPGGAILLDGRPAQFGFAPVGVIVPQMTIGSGALSGLTLNGQPISTTDPGPIGGGSLSALFSVRDEAAITAQSEIDALARDLVERFADPALDPTLPVGAPGLFTDAGVAFAPANEIGLAGRVAINALVDPAAGGALWRLRDGLGSVTQGPIGDATLLQALSDALTDPRVPASGSFSGVAHSAAGLSADLISGVNLQLSTGEADHSFALAKFDALKSAELRGGVDTDQEMQQLLLIERAYSANARVVSTVDEMIQTLLSI